MNICRTSDRGWQREYRHNGRLHGDNRSGPRLRRRSVHLAGCRCDLTILWTVPIHDLALTSKTASAQLERRTGGRLVWNSARMRRPQQVSSTRTWLNNGDIVQTGNETHRACFIETEGLDPIYTSLSTLLGLPIDRFVIDLAAKATVIMCGLLLPRT